MVLDVKKIFGAFGSVGATKVNPQSQVSGTYISQNNFGIKGSADPYNQGQLSPVTDCSFDSNKWLREFAT